MEIDLIKAKEKILSFIQNSFHSMKCDFQDGGTKKLIKNKYFIFSCIIFIIIIGVFSGGDKSTPNQKIVESFALQLAGVQPPRFATTKFKITNQFTKELHNETVFIYETVFKIKDTETGEIMGSESTQTPDGIINSTFGIVKRGNKWYPKR